MNFAKLANFAMDCEFGNAVANLAKWFAKLAMGFAKLAMQNFAKVIWQWVCEIGNGLRNAQYPAATVPLLLHPAASYPVFNCISFPPLFL